MRRPLIALAFTLVACAAPLTSLTAQSDIPELPHLLKTSLADTPSPGRNLAVAAGGKLQAAFDSALPGDRITLACGASFVGNFVLRAKPGTGWITVASAPECATPAEGIRTSPAQKFARIASSNGMPAIATNGAASRWRFVGLEISVEPSVSTSRAVIALGCANDCERDTVSQPRDIIFDRSYIHGTATVDVRRCVGFNGARLAVIDSYVSDCHSTFDAQAIAGWNGPGPFKIVNNYLEGAAENIAFGGADPAIANLVPSDIEVRRNHITKPMKWKGGKWLVKNLVEFKVGRRVLIEGNVIENSWPSAQNGFAFVLWSVNQQTTCTWCVTEHVTIQNNLIRNVAGGWSMVATGANGLPQYKTVPMNHVAIRNNVVIGLDNAAVSGNGRLFEITDAIQFLSIEHNTGFSPSNASFIWAGVLPLPNHVVRNNLVGGGQYQIFTPYGQGQVAWSRAGGPGSVFDHNAVAAFSGGNMIAANWGLSSLGDVGLVGGAGAATSPTATLDDLVLAPGSQLKRKATDGKDVGADIAAVKAAIANVVRQ